MDKMEKRLNGKVMHGQFLREMEEGVDKRETLEVVDESGFKGGNRSADMCPPGTVTMYELRQI